MVNRYNISQVGTYAVLNTAAVAAARKYALIIYRYDRRCETRGLVWFACNNIYRGAGLFGRQVGGRGGRMRK